MCDLPGSVSPKPGGGCADKGPGVLPEPGDLTSSFIAPPYDSDELGGLWKIKRKNGNNYLLVQLLCKFWLLFTFTSSFLVQDFIIITSCF